MRDTLANWVALGVACLLITALFAGPGLLSGPAHPAYCHPSRTENVTVDDHTYCITPLGAFQEQCSDGTTLSSQRVNWTSFLGFTFGLSWAGGGACGSDALNITVIEPVGATYHGQVGLPGFHVPNYGIWIAPDKTSGFDWRGGNPVVMVSAES
jgi:hypothetical protein